MTIWSLVLALHILAMAIWTGGMAYALMVLRPSLGVLAPPDRLVLLGQTFRRFFLIVWHAMPLVLITGWAMVFGVYGGFAALPVAVNVMQTLGLVMAILFLVVFFGPWRRFRAQPSAEAAGSIRSLITANLALAAATIVVAAFARW
ncbi:CopD family protein [Acidisphaera sp. L21]|uniref:CopD family protein n=1 Tax=Acidisphaera sp. L21 TaxID=1641851 RepID=UPI00131BB84A|nr:CopD family protein [Acidisphaera sp. L21]